MTYSDYRKFATHDLQSFTPNVGAKAWIAPRRLPDTLVSYRQLQEWSRQFLFYVPEEIPDTSLTSEHVYNFQFPNGECNTELSFSFGMVLFSSPPEVAIFSSLVYASQYLVEHIVPIEIPYPLRQDLIDYACEYIFQTCVVQVDFSSNFLLSTPFFIIRFDSTTVACQAVVTPYYLEEFPYNVFHVPAAALLDALPDALPLDPFAEPVALNSHQTLYSAVFDFEAGFVGIGFSFPFLFSGENLTFGVINVEAEWQRFIIPDLHHSRICYVAYQFDPQKYAFYYSNGRIASLYIVNSYATWVEGLANNCRETVEHTELKEILFSSDDYYFDDYCPTYVYNPQTQLWEFNATAPFLFSSGFVYDFSLLDSRFVSLRNSYEVLFLKKASSGNVRARLYNQNQVVSQFYLPSLQLDSSFSLVLPVILVNASPFKIRGRLPISQLNGSFEQVSLKDVGICLLGLAAMHAREEIFFVLAELVYLWGYALRNIDPENPDRLNPQGEGILPEVLDRVGADDTVNWRNRTRNAEATAWFVYGLVYALRAISDQPLAERYWLPSLIKSAKLMLYHHAYFLAKMVSHPSGQVYKEVVQQNQLVREFSIATNAIVLLALKEYLTIEFDLFAAVSAVFLEESILNNLETPEKLSAKDAVYLLLYAYLHDLPEFANPLCMRYATQVQSLNLTNRQSLELHCLFSYVQSRFSTIAQVSSQRRRLWRMERFWCPVGKDLFQLKGSQENNAYLWDCTWNLLRQRNVPLRKAGYRPFWVYTEETLTYIEYIYQMMQQFWPFGIKWTHPKLEHRYYGTLGNLFHTLSRQFASWYLAYAILRDGRVLTNSQAFALDALYRYHLFPDHPFTSDAYKRTRFNPELWRNSRDELQKFYNFHFGRNALFVSEYFPSEYGYDANAFNGLELIPPEQRPTQSNVVNETLDYRPPAMTRIAAGSGISDEPGFIDPETGLFIPWMEVLPKASLYVYALHCPNINSILDRIVPLGSGIEMKPTLGTRDYFVDLSTGILRFRQT